LFSGQGIGGFVGGQLVDNLGVSLPLLFKIFSGFLCGSSICLYFVYNVLCKKYEDQLIKHKEEELLKLQVNKNQEVANRSSTESGSGDINQESLDVLEETKCDLQFGNSIIYFGNQVAGISRF
jgi:hypothetical protein